ncbi:MAG: hypothetical protein KY475_03720 [Planctomycetes bacterium]|nr:hypothetical protein [Planctomycetota bacterium]
MRALIQGVLIVGAIASTLHAQETGEPREQIGVVLGKPIYRDQIDGKSLHALMLRPVLEKYRQAHQDEIKPTEEEIATAIEYFREQHEERLQEREPELRRRLEAVQDELARSDLSRDERKELGREKDRLERDLRPPGRSFALFILDNWKFQRHLYDHYGGGRILWQQAGIEAFDAMHNWLEDQEAKGEFKIADPKLRQKFYHYWTRDHGAFLTSDEERIRNEFLAPGWAAEPGTN